MTPADLAKKSGISQGHISHILTQTRKPSATTLGAIAKALDLPPEVVFQKAGLLPSAKGEPDQLEKEWEHLFDQASTDEERKELIDRARFELTRIRERRAQYSTGKRQTP